MLTALVVLSGTRNFYQFLSAAVDSLDNNRNDLPSVSPAERGVGEYS